jgi:hypothetical protein
MHKHWLSACLLAVLPALSGCLYHTHKVQQPQLAGPAMSATVAQLVNSVNQRYDSIQSLNATVEFAASTGGARKGKQTDITPFRGYILLRKPNMLRVLGLVPVLHTRAFDLASDGTTFKLLIPPRSKAIVGTNSVTQKSPNALENLRPDIFLDAILVRSITPGRLVYLTTHDEIVRDAKTKQLIETPEYDLLIGDERPAQQDEGLGVRVIRPTRVIHFSRLNLMPQEQDIYDDQGEVATKVVYGPYQDFSGFKYPSWIRIERPLEEYQILVTVQKVTANQPLSDEQFQLTIPPSYQVTKLH